ncbi:MAG: Ig-like domain-containing protein [Paludibacteraceae bacterium]|nr:Ig-like domain-containing protein [Paludibacteraceae bacterium]
MRKLKLFLSMLMLICFNVGNVWAAEELKATLDFTSQANWNIPTSGTNTAAASFTDGTYTIQLAAATNYKLNSGYLILGKSGSTLTLPAFSWNTTKILVTGASGASASVKQNIFVGSDAVSTETTGAQNVTNTYEIASASQAAGTIYILKITSAHNTQIAKIEIYGEGEGGGSTKTLESLAISGDPTKTSYYAGQNFDPAGLVVTGHYSDNTDAPITSGITWAYDPSQTLALNQTSIGVTATVSEISSPKYNVTGLTVTEAPAAVNYEKVTAEPADWSGEYLLVYEADATNARVWKGADQANNYAVATISAGVIAAPEGAAVLTIAKVAESNPVAYTIMVGENYIGQTSDANGIKIQATAINNSISYNGTDAAVDIVASSAHLRYNSASSSYFRYYKSATYSSQKKIQLYKKVEGGVKPAAGLEYAAADQKKLAKLGDAFTAPTLINPNSLTVSYASNNTDVAEVAANGAVTIKAAGVAVITASFAGNDDFKAGSASYTVGVTAHAGTEADPYVAADAKTVIDVKGTVENAYASGVVSKVVTTTLPADGYITFDFSADGATTGQQIQAFKCYGLNSAPFEAVSDVETGATVVITGTLKKYNSTYEFDQNCHLVSYEAPAVPKTHIANTKETAYTVAQAITYAADGVHYDLDDYVYVSGVVYDVKSFNTTNGTLDIYIKDANAENQFELYKCAGINDGSATTPFEALTDIQVGNIVIGYGQLTVYNSMSELKQGNYIVDFQKPVTGIQLDATAEVEEGSTVNLTATILPSNATGTIVWSVESGDAYASVENGVVTGIAEGEAVIRATVQGTEIYAECTVTIKPEAAPDTRKIANSPAEFEEISGNMSPADITFAAYKGGAGNDPFITSGKALRLYQKSGSNTFGGFITLTAKAGCTIDEVQITTTSAYSTSVAYSVDGNATLSESESVAASSSYTTGTGLNASSVNILNLGSGSSGRLEIASIKVYYTGEPAAIDHYELGGTYQTAFMQNEDFNHTGLIVYAAYDALGENKVDITSMCTFSEPDMSTTGEKTIEITYNEAVVISYTINVAADSRKVAESPVTFTTVSGDMTPNDITFASNQGGASTAPANYNDGIRLYQAPSADAIGGFITLKAKKGCTIDQVKITTTNSYATTVAYSVDGNENLLGSESVAKSSDYSTPSGLNVESVNIVNKGTGSSGRLEIASIKVWYTGDALAVDHYILGGTYATEFEQYGEFNYEGLTVTAAYDAGATITEAVTGFTVEADLSTAGAKKANVMLNSVKIAEYDITVTASAKEDPALTYSPVSVVLTLGQSLSAPTLSNTHNVSPITYSSDKPAVATVDADGNIALAGGCGTAVITASFAGDDDYIDSEATFTITVNEPAEDLSGTWVLATSVAAGDKIIIGATYQDATKSMGAQNGNNRLAVASTLDAGVLSPGEGTKVFTLVDAGDGKFAIQALNGNYLSAAGTGTSNYLKEAADYTADNAKWSISIDGEGVASVVALSENRNAMQYNSGSTLFSCYASVTSQRPINIYKKDVPVKELIRGDLSNGKWGTLCPKQNVENVEGATFYQISYLEENGGLPYNMVFDQISGTTLTAGQPYFFIANATEIRGNKTGDAVDAAGAGVNGFYGYIGDSPKPLSWQADYNPSGDNTYVIYGNMVTRLNGPTDLKSERCYININSTEPSRSASAPMPGRARFMINVGGHNTPTGMDQITNDQLQMSNKVIINGHLYILRSEKMYDATGRLVK